MGPKTSDKKGEQKLHLHEHAKSEFPRGEITSYQVIQSALFIP